MLTESASAGRWLY
ncbi:hypothetical protein L8961_002816 [Serratia marcescens]|nr:hypothetical protein [Serratia marcescens]MBH3189335.1 hypothetical protein [Serratia marcescens]NMQ37633.1 hypothetical protein [Serratia marcescens]HAT3796584.1 hypothetical protein [Serratia marcescens]HEJ0019562.1 hypothetical protein [Serratia marcescens]